MRAFWRSLAAALVATAAGLALSSALAQTSQQLEWCINIDVAYQPDLQIAGCSAVIQSGRYSGRDLNWAFHNRGIAYYSKGQYDRAIAEYNEAIRLDSNAARTFNNRGNAYAAKGDNDRAIADFNEAIRLEPADASAFNNRGIAYHNKGQYDRAIADYNDAIRLDPRAARTFNNRGNAYRAKNDANRAIADYNEAILLNPNYATAFKNRGNAYSAKGDNFRATADFDEAIRLDTKNAAAAEAKRQAAIRPESSSAAPVETKQQAAIRAEPSSAATPTETKQPETTIPQQMPQPTTEQPTGQSPTAYGAGEEPKVAAIIESKRSRWILNDSIVYLVTDGAKQKIYFESPRSGLVSAGVKPGTLLFEGQKNGQTYAGTAYQFYRTCEPRAYQVSGRASDDGREITLKGDAPMVDSGCNIVISVDLVLMLVASENASRER